MKLPLPTRAARLAMLLALCSAPALAHDTWFERLSAAGAPALLALGTGNQFPLRETAVGAEYLVQQGCHDTMAGRGAPAAALTPLRVAPAALLLRAAASAQTCWVQLQPFELELAPDKVALYLDEANASDDLRATWARMQARGLPWRERYTKHARIELEAWGPAAPTRAPRTSARTPLALDAVMEQTGAANAEQLLFTVLRDGLPLPGFAVELRAASAAAGARHNRWLRTDAQGQVQVPLPPPGRWLLRGIDLRLSQADADRWDSRFLTLAFDVKP